MPAFIEHKPVPEIVPPPRVPENPQPGAPRIEPAEDPKIPEKPKETPPMKPWPEYEPKEE